MKYVYLLKCGDNHYKVGVASNVTSRFAGIRTSNHERIEIVSVKLVSDALAIERVIHDYLSDHQTNGGTEWFKLDAAQVIEVLIMLHKEPEINVYIEETSLRGELMTHSNEFINMKKNLDKIVKYLKITDPEQLVEPVEKKPLKENISRRHMLENAIDVIKKYDRASASLLQARLSIGYARAARIIEELEQLGFIGPASGAKAREVLNTDIMKLNESEN